MATIFEAMLPFIHNMRKDQIGDDRFTPKLPKSSKTKVSISLGNHSLSFDSE